MKTLQTIRMLRDDPKNAWYYIQGTLRQFVFDRYPSLIRSHILEQYFYRISKAPDCSKNKSCVFCGCKTDDLFFSDKACGLSKLTPANIKLFGKDTYCYPKMMNKKEWEVFKEDLL